MYVYSVEGLTQTAFDFGSNEYGWEIAKTHLHRAYRACNKLELNYHIGRSIHQNRLGFALVALAASAEKDDFQIAGELDAVSLKQELISRVLSGTDRFPGMYPYAEHVRKASITVANKLNQVDTK